MEKFNTPVILGRSGLRVGRLGISSSYGAPAEAFEEAFEKGSNYQEAFPKIEGGKGIRYLPGFGSVE